MILTISESFVSGIFRIMELLQVVLKRNPFANQDRVATKVSVQKAGLLTNVNVWKDMEAKTAVNVTIRLFLIQQHINTKIFLYSHKFFLEILRRRNALLQPTVTLNPTAMAQHFISTNAPTRRLPHVRTSRPEQLVRNLPKIRLPPLFIQRHIHPVQRQEPLRRQMAPD